MPNLDHEIITRILAGEARAFAELVDFHKDKAMTLAMRMLQNREDAEEALQDAFVRAFKALGSFERKSSFATWFYRIVYNVCCTALSKRDQQFQVSLNHDHAVAQLDLPLDAWNPQAEIESSEFQQAVHEEIESLPPAYSAVLTLFFVQELSYEEIVKVTGLPLGTVKNRLFRARMMLREAVLKRMSGSVGERESIKQEMIQ